MESFNLIPSRIEIKYFDKTGRSTTKECAVTMIVTEYDRNDNVLRSLMSAKSQTDTNHNAE